MDPVTSAGFSQQMPLPTSAGNDEYWAKKPPEQLIKVLHGKRDKFYNYLDSSGLLARIERSWRYYHGIFTTGGPSKMDTRKLGRQGEKAGVTVNHYRSVLRLIVSYVTQNRPAWDARATNSDTESLEQCELANDYLDYCMDTKNIEEMVTDAGEEGFIMTSTYVKACWDKNAGEGQVANPETGEILYSGDLSLESLNIFDVIFDPQVKKWKKQKWVLCRTFKNIWDLCEHFHEQKDEILRARGGGDRGEEWLKTDALDEVREDSDRIGVWEFFHLPSAAIPNGRHVTYVGAKAVLEDEDMPYDHLPVHGYSPDKYVLSPFGYSLSFDLQGIQEVRNALYSTIVTNLNNLGPTKIWFKAGDTINLADLEPGINAIQSETEPKPLNLLSSPAEIFKLIDLIRQDDELLSGANSVTRGQPEASLRSHAALALIDAKVIQFISTAQRNYYKFLSDLGTGILKISQKYMSEPQMLSIIGRAGIRKTKAFSGSAIKNIDRVVVDSANPLQRTLAGRYEMAMALLQNNRITAEEFLTVSKTGQIKPATEAADAQLSKCHHENDLLRQGVGMPAALIDNHSLHIEKHSALIDAPDTDPNVYQAVLAHIDTHMQHLTNPISQEYQAALGYKLPLPPGTPGAGPGMPAAGGPPGGPPGASPPGPPGVGPPGAPPGPAAAPPALGGMQ